MVLWPSWLPVPGTVVAMADSSGAMRDSRTDLPNPGDPEPVNAPKIG